MTGELVTRKSGLLETAGGASAMPSEANRGLRVRHQGRDIAGTVNHADDLDAVGDLAVQDEVAPDRKIAKVRRDVGPRRAKSRLIGEQQELLLMSSSTRSAARTSSWAMYSQMSIRSSSACAVRSMMGMVPHASVVSVACAAISRRRASALIAAMSA